MMRGGTAARFAFVLALLPPLLVAGAGYLAAGSSQTEPYRFLTGGLGFFFGALVLAWGLALPLAWRFICRGGVRREGRDIDRAPGPRGDRGAGMSVVLRQESGREAPVPGGAVRLATTPAPGAPTGGLDLRTLSLAVEQSPGAVVITDRDGTIEYVNRKFVEVTGYSSEEAVGQNPRILKAGTTPDEVYRELWRTIRAGGEWRGELENRKKGGELYQECAIISPVKDDRGAVSHYIALKEDVTEKRALEQALRHAQKMESLGTLTGGVAHDFNNVLTAIIGYADLIRMKSAPEDPCSRFATQIAAAAEKAAVLTRGLLAYSRNQPMSPVHLDLNEVVGRLGRILSRVLGEAVVFRATLNPEPLRLLADGALLEQVLMNLAVNARQAMPSGGTLQIRTAASEIDMEFFKRNGFGKPGRYALLSVSDSGVGLDRATRERIFDPFFTAGEGGGTGLGLSIAYGIVKQHRGYIEVESAPGEGTAFRIYLPLAADAPAVEPGPVAESSGETVLLVEDNPEVRSIIAEVLRGARYRVLEAADSEEGLARFREEQERIRLLLVDVVLPGKGGLDLFSAVRELDPGARVLFMSGYPEEEVRARGVLPSEPGFISKPLIPADLLKRVRKVMEG